MLFSSPMIIENRTNIPNLHPTPEGHIDSILERIVTPAARRERILIQKVIRYHERPVILHVRRRHLQQARAAVRELRTRYACAHQE